MAAGQAELLQRASGRVLSQQKALGTEVTAQTLVLGRGISGGGHRGQHGASSSY